MTSRRALANTIRLMSSWPCFPASYESRHAINDIREIVDKTQYAVNDAKPLIKMNVGDPTFNRHLKVPAHVNEAVVEALHSGRFNGYGPSTGFLEARQAVAALYGVDADDVFLTSGCSHALELTFAALANPGDEILLPRPGFCEYKTKLLPRRITPVHYDLLPDQGWTVDLKDLK